jgi:hypothetical protein
VLYILSFLKITIQSVGSIVVLHVVPQINSITIVILKNEGPQEE